MEESNFNKFWNLWSICYFQKYFLTTHLNIYKIYWFYWLDLWISYKIMLYLLHLNKNSNRKNMPKLGFPNYFIVNKVKQNVAQTLQSKICVIWWLRQLDASMRFLGSNSCNSCTWILIPSNVYNAYFGVCVCIWCKEDIGGYPPTYHFIT
jgi:hypothetical protein